MLIALGALHPLHLRMLAWPLQTAEATATADYYALHGGELGIDGLTIDRAVQWHDQATGRKILLVLPRTSRIVEIGAAPSFEQTCRRELTKRGVPVADVETLDAEARDAWEAARSLDGWLKCHPHATVALACNLFDGGRLRYVFDRVLGPDGPRMRLVPAADPACPAAAWWRTRAGVKDFMYAWLELIYAWRQGGGPRVAQPGAAEFQREVRTAIGEAPP